MPSWVTMFYDGFSPIVRIVIMAICSYIVLTAVVRISGKRTITQMSAFDQVITFALGSTLASVILTKNVALAEGVAAFATLCVLQFATSWLFTRFPAIEAMVKAHPSLLVYHQQFQREVMKKTRISEMDIRGAVRSHGHHWEEVEAVILEIDGTLAVIPKSSSSPATYTLKDVKPNPFDDPHIYPETLTRKQQQDKEEQ